MKDYRKEVLADLKQAVSNSRSIRLPDQKHVSFPEYDKKHVTIKMKTAAVIANMQTDVSAFEAWAVALHYWLNGLDVCLEWEKPDDASVPEHSVNRGHYMRFLFRIKNFSEWFSWFNISTRMKQEAEAWKPENPNSLILNRKSLARDTCYDKPSDGATENELERYLASSDGQKKISKVLGWERGYILERQFPVGLFKGDPPTKNNSLFSHGKSAMDLCAVDGKVVHVIELKKFKAKPKMGVLAEVLFYAALIRGVQTNQIRFTQKNSHSENGFENHLINTNSVQAHILAPSLHPLLDCGGIFAVINTDCAKNNITVGYLELRSGCNISCRYDIKH